MIYLIQSAYIDENDNFHKALKIGYAKDLDKRLVAYNTHLPSYKLLKTRDGDENLEKHLHIYFSRYRLSNHEWFEYDEKIIEEFDKITLETILPVESVVYEPKVNKNVQGRKDLRVIKIFHFLLSLLITDNPFINKIIKEELEKIDLRLYDKRLIEDWVEFYNLIKSNVESRISIIKKEQEILQKFVNDNSFSHDFSIIFNSFDYDFIGEKDFIDKLSISDKIFSKDEAGLSKFLLNFVSLSKFPEKMKLYCEFRQNSNHQSITNYLEIPSEFHKYYNLVGPQKIKSLKYQESELKRVIKEIEKSDELTLCIYGAFNVGDRLSRVDIAKGLQNIYNQLNIKKIAVATDLFEYFESKEAWLQDKITKKRSRGFELLSKKKLL